MRTDGAPDLAAARSFELSYRNELSRRRSAEVRYAGPRNGLWTGTGLPQRMPAAPAEFLIGRVRTTRPDEGILGGRFEFYIGTSHATMIDAEVFSWTAPIACTFFDGPIHHDLCDRIAEVRTFMRDSRGITSYADDVGAHSGKQIYVGSRRHANLTVEPHLSKKSDRQLRAEAALRATVAAPKLARLSPLLSTLQPDQYALVSAPAMDSMVVEGGPGSGKTVVAVHRAAYVTSDSTPPENGMDKNVLVVGPTDGYVDHVAAAIYQLADDPDRIRVGSLTGLLTSAAGLTNPPAGDISSTWMDAHWKLGVLARRAVDELARKNEATTMVAAYNVLRKTASGGGVSREWAVYLGSLPPLAEAREKRLHLPLLAIIGWLIAPPDVLRDIEHIVVDEAQDVTALEWFFLQLVNEAGAYTILGDLHQRRSDHTLANWDDVLDILTLDPGDVRQHLIDRGYRSTQPVLDYAQRLLPRDHRAGCALQKTGPEPAVFRVRPDEVAKKAVAHAEAILERDAVGRIGVIAPDVEKIARRLAVNGWKRADAVETRWERNGLALELLESDLARGLEFDAVIVVEPSDFARNYGRYGPLYTALTRTNCELVIVHSLPMPGPLTRR